MLDQGHWFSLDRKNLVRTMCIDEDGTIEGKAVVELRVSRSKFMDIAKEINMRVKDIQKGTDVMVMFG